MSKFARCYRPLHPTGGKQMKKKPYKKVFKGWMHKRPKWYGRMAQMIVPVLRKEKHYANDKKYSVTYEEVKQ